MTGYCQTANKYRWSTASSSHAECSELRAHPPSQCSNRSVDVELHPLIRVTHSHWSLKGWAMRPVWYDALKSIWAAIVIGLSSLLYPPDKQQQIEACENRKPMLNIVIVVPRWSPSLRRAEITVCSQCDSAAYLPSPTLRSHQWCANMPTLPAGTGASGIQDRRADP